MPEGDTIHRAARTIQEAIGGKVVTGFQTVFPALARIDADAPIRGRTIERATAIGKHLLIELSGPLVLRTHMRMNGSWHLYRPGEAWQRRRSEMRILLATDEWIAVGFNIPVAEFLDPAGLARSRVLRRLGPDVLSVAFDFAEAGARIRASNGRKIAEVLLDQSVIAGIGNVYKSELLFLAAIHPGRPVESVSDTQIDELLSGARRLLQHNVNREADGRETRRGLRPAERLWVYGREGKPCRRCGTAIVMEKQGLDARVTFWCPACQPLD